MIGFVLPATNTHLPTDEQLGAALTALAAGGIRVAVEVDDQMHVYPLQPLTTAQEVTTLRAFAGLTDYRLAWHPAL